MSRPTQYVPIALCLSSASDNIGFKPPPPLGGGSVIMDCFFMVSIALIVDARKTSLTGVQNSKKIGSPLRGSWGQPPPLEKS